MLKIQQKNFNKDRFLTQVQIFFTVYILFERFLNFYKNNCFINIIGFLKETMGLPTRKWLISITLAFRRASIRAVANAR